jgi:PKD repeat protein
MKKIALFSVEILLVLLLAPMQDCHAWWSTGGVRSVHAKISAKAFGLVLPELTKTFLIQHEDDIVGYTTGTQNDADAHGNMTSRNGGYIHELFSNYLRNVRRGQAGYGDASKYLGYCMHLIADMNVPAHARNINHTFPALDNVERMSDYMLNTLNLDLLSSSPIQESDQPDDPTVYYDRSRSRTITNISSDGFGGYWHAGTGDQWCGSYGVPGCDDGPKGYYTNPTSDRDIFPVFYSQISQAEKNFLTKQLNQAVEHSGMFLLAVDRMPDYGITIQVSSADFLQLTSVDFSAGRAVWEPVNIANYSWDFGEPESGSRNTSSSATPSHYFINTGTHMVTLTITDANTSNLFTVTKEVTIQPYPLTVTAPYGVEDLYRRFDTCANDLIKSYTWDFGDGVVINGGVSTSHVYSTSGYFTVRLTLTLQDDTTLTREETFFAGPGTVYIQGHTINGEETWFSGGTYVVQGDVTVVQGAVLTVEPGTTVLFGSGRQLYVNGTLNATGASFLWEDGEDQVYGIIFNGSGGSVGMLVDTLLKGVLTIQSGSLTVDNLVIK